MRAQPYSAQQDVLLGICLSITILSANSPTCLWNVSPWIVHMSANLQVHEISCPWIGKPTNWCLRIIDPQIDMSVKRVPMKRPVTIMGIYLSDSLTAVWSLSADHLCFTPIPSTFRDFSLLGIFAPHSETQEQKFLGTFIPERESLLSNHGNWCLWHTDARHSSE